jgi:Protein of unknown function (DUF1236)
MRSKLLISTAALLAGVALASAQGMQGEQRGGAAQGPQSQSSPKQSPSQDGMQGKQQDRSQRGEGGQATDKAQPESGAQQGKQGQSQQRNQSQKQRDQTSGEGSQRQGQTGQSQEGQTQPGRAQPSQTQPSQTQSGQAPQQGQTQQGQTQQGQAGQSGGSANLTTEQRTRVRQTVLTGSNVPRVNNVNFALSVGTTVPTRVRVVAVPAPLIEIYPEWRRHMYFVVGDQIIIVDRNHRIVAVISV